MKKYLAFGGVFYVVIGFQSDAAIPKERMVLVRGNP